MADLACVSGCECEPQVGVVGSSGEVCKKAQPPCVGAALCAYCALGSCVASGAFGSRIGGRLISGRRSRMSSLSCCLLRPHLHTQVLDGTWQQEVSLQQILQIWVSRRRTACCRCSLLFAASRLQSCACWTVANDAGNDTGSICTAVMESAAWNSAYQPSSSALFCCSTHHLRQVSRHKQCRIRVTVSERPGQVPQKGHKVRRRSALPRHLHACSAKAPACLLRQAGMQPRHVVATMSTPAPPLPLHPSAGGAARCHGVAFWGTPHHIRRAGVAAAPGQHTQQGGALTGSPLLH